MSDTADITLSMIHRRLCNRLGLADDDPRRDMVRAELAAVYDLATDVARRHVRRLRTEHEAELARRDEENGHA